MNTQQTALQTMWQVFFEPNKAFASVKERGGFLMPLMLLMLSSIIVIYIYARRVDFAWFVDHLVSDSMADAPRDQVESFRAHFTREGFIRNALVMTALGTLGLLIVMSAYLAIVSAALGATHSFTRWFAFTCWANVPLILSNLGMLAVVSFDGSGQLSLATLDPQSLNSLLHLEQNQHFFKLASLVSLPQIWVWVAMIIGFSLWSKRSLGLSAAIVVLPYLGYSLIF